MAVLYSTNMHWQLKASLRTDLIYTAALKVPTSVITSSTTNHNNKQNILLLFNFHNMNTETNGSRREVINRSYFRDSTVFLSFLCPHQLFGCAFFCFVFDCIWMSIQNKRSERKQFGEFSHSTLQVWTQPKLCDDFILKMGDFIQTGIFSS